jgi:DNA-binding NtrC family response regulator
MIDVKFDVKALVDSLVSERINVPVIACGIGTDASAAVRAIRAGAKEYIPLPPDADLIAAVIAAVTEETHTIVYRDPVMGQLIRMAEQVAPSDASILVTGESGTGKELIARLVHKKSRRAQKRFIAINCAAIPENLLESELFGHEKGAFTGAVARRLGKFEEATGGTLLLDEISEMDIRLQAKLLRALQEKEIDRIGGNVPVKIDVRIIATSNRSMEDEVRRGTFREDLFFRLNVVNLRIPSLRERPLDIEMLAVHFQKKYAEMNGIPSRPLTDAAKRMLLTHMWRGNVRELENTMHRAVLLANGSEIGPEAILLTGTPIVADPAATVVATAAAAASAATGATKQLVGRTVSDVERDLIIDTLQHCLGNRTHAANILGISIRTLRNKLRQYSDEGIPVPPPGDAEHSAV